MQFYMPVKVWEEEHCVENHAAELSSLGKHALIVTGHHSSRLNGSLDDVRNALSSTHIPFTVFDEVEENPSEETVMKARETGLQTGADFVIGIGGGSAMDAAKAIALMIRHPEGDQAYLYNPSADSSAVPVAEVPTTCGTGSEVTAVSVLTRTALKTKGSIPHKIFARYAFLDGRYLATASPKVLASTSIDAFAHLIESAVNTKATPYSMMLVRQGLRTWSLNKPFLLKTAEEGNPISDLSGSNHISPLEQTIQADNEYPRHLEDYFRLMRASAFAGMAIAQTGTSLPHGLSYPVTFDTHMPHGTACGYFEAGYLAETPGDLRRLLLHDAGFDNISQYQDFFLRLCHPASLPAEELEHAVDMLAGNQEKLRFAPFPVTREVLHRIAFYSSTH